MTYQASKKTDFTVDLLWWGSLRLTPIIGKSLSKPQRRKWYVGPCMKNCREKWNCNTLRTTVWYGGSCTNKHDRFMDTSIQELSNTKKFLVSFTDVPY